MFKSISTLKRLQCIRLMNKLYFENDVIHNHSCATPKWTVIFILIGHNMIQFLDEVDIRKGIETSENECSWVHTLIRGKRLDIPCPDRVCVT